MLPLLLQQLCSCVWACKASVDPAGVHNTMSLLSLSAASPGAYMLCYMMHGYCAFIGIIDSRQCILLEAFRVCFLTNALRSCMGNLPGSCGAHGVAGQQGCACDYIPG